MSADEVKEIRAAHPSGEWWQLEWRTRALRDRQRAVCQRAGHYDDAADDGSDNDYSDSDYDSDVEVVEPQVSAPQDSEAQVSAPQDSEAQVSAPQDSEAQVSAPRASEARCTLPPDGLPPPLWASLPAATKVALRRTCRRLHQEGRAYYTSLHLKAATPDTDLHALLSPRAPPLSGVKNLCVDDEAMLHGPVRAAMLAGMLGRIRTLTIPADADYSWLESMPDLTEVRVTTDADRPLGDVTTMPPAVEALTVTIGSNDTRPRPFPQLFGMHHLCRLRLQDCFWRPPPLMDFRALTSLREFALVNRRTCLTVMASKRSVVSCELLPTTLTHLTLAGVSARRRGVGLDRLTALEVLVADMTGLTGPVLDSTFAACGNLTDALILEEYCGCQAKATWLILSHRYPHVYTSFVCFE